LIPPQFEYAAPKTLQEAVELLRTNGEGAKVLAGGQSLIPLLKLRLASPSLLVDMSRIPGLDYIRESEESLTLGAMVRVASLLESSLLRTKYPVIYEAAKTIADPLVRNLGTVGGNLSHGDPSNDLPAVMLALGAELAATGPTGDRVVKAEGFYLDAFTTALARYEILTEARVPVPPPRSAGTYLKVEMKVADFATVGVAVQVTTSRTSEFTRVGIGLTAVGPTVIKAKKAEEALLGKKITDAEAVNEAAAKAGEASNPTTDIRGTAEYKRSLVRLLVSRALKISSKRAEVGAR
jgi:carbon-monoxide dehydrogenase medium subunit